MAALVSTVMAVSVTVLAPNPSAAPTTTQPAFRASPEATLGQTVQQWSQENGLAAPQIDKAVASLSIGKLTVTGATVCEAVGRLVSALKYADARPEMTRCGSDGAVISRG